MSKLKYTKYYFVVGYAIMGHILPKAWIAMKTNSYIVIKDIKYTKSHSRVQTGIFYYF